ncbi:bcl-2-like protein 12 [Python bivittatus]|uniref:Bcl-2-like protein 12 n=1 Tax=Python bivittatus TaxID=176946 RepID=A0A9F5IKU8_PYTBI|nr:bcl-2-like protein 12 [Python bivittatus]XP_007423160.1 bcl-2-like protein 12 [Python bivittatus]XP_025019091.1 bcl-2-like protein 12 [Python bivittatus]
MAGSPVPPRRQVVEETRLVLEAFLQGALSSGEKGAPGHIGRGYHDPQSYMSRSPVEHALECPACSPAHEESNSTEGKKHGFRTSIKHLLQKRSNSRGPSDSLPSSGDSLKKSKPGAEGAHRKRPFYKSLLKKKGAASAEIADPVAHPQRPDSLPLVTCYCRKQAAEPEEVQIAGNGEAEGAEFYTLVAQKLDYFVKQQQWVTPAAAKSSPSPTDLNTTIPADTISGNSAALEKLPGESDEKQKEQILQKLVALLEEQAAIFNKKIEADPLLRNTISRLSYRSFTHLAEAFTSRTPPGVSSPQLAKLALTMELTRKVAGINSHTVHTVMGYSLQYMDMFIPWLQQQGGWESIVAQEEIFDLQLD